MTLCKDKRGLDKLLHFIMGLVIALIVGVIFAHIPPHMPWWTLTVALAAVAVVGFIKEIHDSRMTGNHFCLWDWLWTMSGGIAICWLPWLAAYLLAIDG